MGKYVASLLILTTSILLPGDIFADEQIRRVQEELRKRHLFYANPNGEQSRALTAAIKRYQEKKGFAATGILDSETLASLGLARVQPLAARTPIVLRHGGEIRGANGEKLPSYPPFLWPGGERLSQFDPVGSGQDRIELSMANPVGRDRQRPRLTGEPSGLTNDLGEAGAPGELAFALTGHTTGNAVGNGLLVQSRPDNAWEFGALDEERVEVAVKSKARSARRKRHVKARKETNPFVLTFQSVDRAIRNLFGDAQTKKRRSTTKRL